MMDEVYASALFHNNKKKYVNKIKTKQYQGTRRKFTSEI